ncbi:MAG: endonuclease/exonuclease/phosphatase family protein [Tyzzerella sp.]|nr:endonuclease/exonuclease/phosphatase family protein [Tyzzerella sp.]
MKKSVKVILISALLLIGIISFQLIAGANDDLIDNKYGQGFNGYTSDEGQIRTSDYISSTEIAVAAGETVWFGPCEETQYFHLVGFDADGNAVTDKVRGKELEVVDTFSNGLVIYKYKVPSGVAKLIFSAPASLAEVYTVSKAEFSCLSWDAHWTKKGFQTSDYVGQSSFYKVADGKVIYFGAITKEDALASVTYDENANKIGTINASDLKLVESFGGDYGIYCYTANDSSVKYVQVPYDTDYEQYYTYLQKAEALSDEAVIEYFISTFGIQRPLSSTVQALAGKSALFVGDSITFGARDRAKIYKYGGWAGRIGYFCDMDVLNNGVSGACITKARIESHSEKHYIYNNLVAAKGNKYDYVIMHGLFNDASISVDVNEFATELTLLFDTAKAQHPEATLGYIVNFETERAVDQAPYVDKAIEICKAKGIEYLDLYHNSTFDVEFDDGLHPSSAGYDSMYTIVANWMAKLGKGSSTDTTTSSAKVMSYNVYYDTGDTRVTNRLQKVAAVITAQNPDILMLQEACTGSQGWVPQIIAYAEQNGYGYYGFAHKADKGIDSSAADKDTTTAGGSEGEMTPILWKTSKYNLVKKGHFWASATPNVAGSENWTVGGNTINSGYPRCISWVILEDKATGEELLVVNYHAAPDKDGKDNTLIRNLTAQLVVEKISEIQTANSYPATILGGDLNMADGSTAYTTITGNGYQDICKAADESDNCGSYNAWERTDRSKYAKGDYLFMDEGTTSSSYKVIDDIDPDNANMHVSDHSPIMAIVNY